jgi:hypothetical protein
MRFTFLFISQCNAKCCYKRCTSLLLDNFFPLKSKGSVFSLIVKPFLLSKTHYTSTNIVLIVYCNLGNVSRKTTKSNRWKASVRVNRNLRFRKWRWRLTWRAFGRLGWTFEYVTEWSTHVEELIEGSKKFGFAYIAMAWQHFGGHLTLLI